MIFSATRLSIPFILANSSRGAVSNLSRELYPAFDKEEKRVFLFPPSFLVSYFQPAVFSICFVMRFFLKCRDSPKPLPLLG